jgi:hypothetical protein
VGDVYRLAALSPDELRDAIDECAVMITAAAPGPAPGNTAADMAEWWMLLNQAMSTGVPLPTAWAASAGDDRDGRPTATVPLPEGTP